MISKYDEHIKIIAGSKEDVLSNLHYDLIKQHKHYLDINDDVTADWMQAEAEGVLKAIEALTCNKPLVHQIKTNNIVRVYNET
jgi:hypothetical protein